MEAKKHFSRRGAEAQRRWCESRYFGIQILEIFIFLRWLAWGLLLNSILKISAPLRLCARPFGNLLSAKFQHLTH
jgi:hypothetical protein